MPKQSIKLSTLKIGEDAEISSIDAEEDFKKRLSDLGIIKGTNITAIHKSPSGDPVAYFVKGTVIALRKEDSDKIMVKSSTSQQGDNYEKGI